MAPSSDAVGVIVPPPDIRTIIDKMAKFVAKHGAEFEAKVIATERENPKFSFVHPSDHYHAYYKQEVQALIAPPPAPPVDTMEVDSGGQGEGDGDVAMGEAEGEETAAKAQAAERKTFLDKLRSGVAVGEAEDSAAKQKQRPTEPPKRQFVVPLPQYAQTTPLDLDIIRLTAQFVARNGDQFRHGLSQREMRNAQFDFMKLGHPAFHYFQMMVQNYTACLLPPRDHVESLRSTTNGQVLERVLKDVEWRRFQASNTGAHEQQEKAERDARAVIDWHSFVIVETIDFDEKDDLPAPQKMSDDAKEEAVEEAMDVDMEQQADAPMKIRKDYQPTLPGMKRAKQSAKCPICGQEMPVDELDEHMRIELADRRGMQQQQRSKQDSGPSALAPSLDIHRHLAALKDHRTDIFGDEEEFAIGTSKAGPGATKADAAIWDGHSSTAPMATAAVFAAENTMAQAPPPAQQQPPTNISLPMKRPTTEPPTQRPPGMGHGPPGMMQRPPGMPPGMPPGAPPGMPQRPPGQFPGQPGGPPMQRPPMPGMPMQRPGGPPPGFPGQPGGRPPMPGMQNSSVVEEQPAKRTKLGDWTDNLEAEDEFAAKHEEPLKLGISVPKQESKSDWKLNGQRLMVEIGVKETVGSLKAKLTEATGVPGNKLKLKVEGLPVLRDNLTLAYYNISSATVVQFGLKERGRKKK